MAALFPVQETTDKLDIHLNISPIFLFSEQLPSAFNQHPTFSTIICTHI